MKIVFLCGCLEPGRDGVGDYTRRLSIELITLGHSVSAVALNDHHLTDIYDGTQVADQYNLSVLRLPANLESRKKFDLAAKWVANYNPDWVSLQFVIYSYHPKGLPANLAKLMAQIGKTAKRHIMFHEIWIGISRISPLKHRVTGYFQKRIVWSLTKHLNPALITTSNIVYHLVLKTEGVNSTILPLFSNIPVSAQDRGATDLLLKNLSIGSEENLKKWRLTGIFGNLYPEAELEKVLNEQLLVARQQNLKLAFISFGRLSGYGVEEFMRLEKLFSGKISFIRLGELSPEDVSGLMQLLDAGISCTPEQHIGKSGVFAAMKLHGLEVIMSAQEVIPEFEEDINNYHQQFVKRLPDEWSAKSVTGQFIELLTKN